MKKVLVVDDSPTVREIMVRELVRVILETTFRKGQSELLASQVTAYSKLDYSCTVGGLTVNAGVTVISLVRRISDLMAENADLLAEAQKPNEMNSDDGKNVAQPELVEAAKLVTAVEVTNALRDHRLLDTKENRRDMQCTLHNFAALRYMDERDRQSALAQQAGGSPK